MKNTEITHFVAHTHICQQGIYEWMLVCVVLNKFQNLTFNLASIVFCRGILALVIFGKCWPCVIWEVATKLI